jgi:predicted nucleotidyltransferase component of viral defense system
VIPKDYITEWRQHAPWLADAQVEQDLVLSRAIVEIYRDEELAGALAFRGGTSLYKLHLTPGIRYSEDIDLVQIRAEPIGPTMDRIRQRLDPLLGVPRRQINEGRVLLVYRFDSEDNPPQSLRLKIEINSREHFAHLGYIRSSYRIRNGWFSGEAAVTTYSFDELIATKLRALYQRKKGRDLFDLWLALDRGLVDEGQTVECFLRYMREGGTPVSRAEFEANLAGKRTLKAFREDIVPLLASEVLYDADQAFERVTTQLVARLPGAPWQGAP